MGHAVKMLFVIFVVAMFPKLGCAQTLGGEISKMTQQLVSFLNDEGHDAVFLGSFDRQFETEMGRDIHRQFEEQLIANSIVVLEEPGSLQLLGDFTVCEQTMHSIVTLKVEVRNSQGRVLNQYRKRVKVLHASSDATVVAVVRNGSLYP
ncbi:hypothetical protein [Rosistilla oblonga]|uniref:Uncharacterized protein n=1 Tax=Rosistilla oblonga TaxID=2527990 RepID=A0A518IP25_9BACT|nr:hypothetical protein [Rosistilla oblonga]QDV54847.1 hypothetical protein Mal33_08120 [Rosistilla oblonga]